MCIGSNWSVTLMIVSLRPPILAGGGDIYSKVLLV